MERRKCSFFGRGEERGLKKVLGESIAPLTASAGFFPHARNESHVRGLQIDYSFHSEHVCEDCVGHRNSFKLQ